MLSLYKNILLLSSVIFLTTYSQIILRMRVNEISHLFSNNYRNFHTLFIIATDFWLISALLAFFLSFFCWSAVLVSDFNITKIYPVIASLIILSVSLANFIFFQDEINLVNILGGFLILLGIILILR